MAKRAFKNFYISILTVVRSLLVLRLILCLATGINRKNTYGCKKFVNGRKKFNFSFVFRKMFKVFMYEVTVENIRFNNEYIKNCRRCRKIYITVSDGGTNFVRFATNFASCDWHLTAKIPIPRKMAAQNL